MLGKLDETATALGLDLTSPESGVKGPSEEDIAAAGTLTEEQRSAMVEGMVEGLAAKLEDNPDNAEGWIMLIRSYSVIGKQDKAKSAYASAVDHFKSNPAVLARLKTDAASLAGVK